jgi:UDP-N-acetylglucosamine:LPS N-acetylglucosamine transferase
MAKDMRVQQQTRVLAVSSSGGHWEQLMLLRDSFEGCDVQYAATLEGLGERSGVGSTFILPDFNATKPWKTLTSLLAVAKVVRKVRPNVVVSTGAAPGLVALSVGKLLGARTIWIDSVANVERLSLSGRMAGHIADLWVTQWRHLARPRGPVYHGAVL